jgi:hypothetical protein
MYPSDADRGVSPGTAVPGLKVRTFTTRLMVPTAGGRLAYERLRGVRPGKSVLRNAGYLSTASGS